MHVRVSDLYYISFVQHGVYYVHTPHIPGHLFAADDVEKNAKRSYFPDM